MSPTDRIETLARAIASREAGRALGRATARDLADTLHARLRDAARRFARAAGEAGAPHLDLVRIGPVEPDDKSVRAFQIKIRRGRWEAVAVCKDHGEVTLVGPYKLGEEQGPCNPIHLERDAAESQRLERDLPELLCRLIEIAFAR